MVLSFAVIVPPFAYGKVLPIMNSKMLPKRVIFPFLSIVSLRSTIGCSVFVAAPIFVVVCVFIVVVDAIIVRPLPPPAIPTDLDKTRAASGDGLGIKNWRSLGGLPTASGRKVKEGVAYRSCELEGFSTFGPGNGPPPATFPHAIKTVVDIRAKSEMSVSPDRVGPESVSVRIPLQPISHSEASVLNFDDRKAMFHLIMFRPSALFQPPNGYPSIDQLPFLAVSRVLTEPKVGDGAIRRITELASDTCNHPILWHCATGKDRTGAVSAALLLALGVSREDIVRDFLLSNYFEFKKMSRTYHFIKLMWLFTGCWGGFLMYGGARLRNILFVQKETLEDAMDRVDKRFRGFDGPAYWKAQGLTEDDLERLREAMLD
mmetsp:Transcript_27579/g.81125  ORF Transcript_27579/g.81125 Transcript_27579/m.81125 type:complete len:374 (-) Transcript_27579:24-1145(-)